MITPKSHKLRKGKAYAKPVYLRIISTRQTIKCFISLHFNNKLADTDQQLETYKVSKNVLQLLGMTGKRFYQLMRGESHFMLSEAIAYAKWQNVDVNELYEFIVPKKRK